MSNISWSTIAFAVKSASMQGCSSSAYNQGFMEKLGLHQGAPVVTIGGGKVVDERGSTGNGHINPAKAIYEELERHPDVVSGKVKAQGLFPVNYQLDRPVLYPNSEIALTTGFSGLPFEHSRLGSKGQDLRDLSTQHHVQYVSDTAPTFQSNSNTAPELSRQSLPKHGLAAVGARRADRNSIVTFGEPGGPSYHQGDPVFYHNSKITPALSDTALAGMENSARMEPASQVYTRIAQYLRSIGNNEGADYIMKGIEDARKAGQPYRPTMVTGSSRGDYVAQKSVEMLNEWKRRGMPKGWSQMVPVLGAHAPITGRLVQQNGMPIIQGLPGDLYTQGRGRAFLNLASSGASDLNELKGLPAASLIPGDQDALKKREIEHLLTPEQRRIIAAVQQVNRQRRKLNPNVTIPSALEGIYDTPELTEDVHELFKRVSKKPGAIGYEDLARLGGVNTAAWNLGGLQDIQHTRPAGMAVYNNAGRGWDIVNKNRGRFVDPRRNAQRAAEYLEAAKSGRSELVDRLVYAAKRMGDKLPIWGSRFLMKRGSAYREGFDDMVKSGWIFSMPLGLGEVAGIRKIPGDINDAFHGGSDVDRERKSPWMSLGRAGMLGAGALFGLGFAGMGVRDLGLKLAIIAKRALKNKAALSEAEATMAHKMDIPAYTRFGKGMHDSVAGGGMDILKTPMKGLGYTVGGIAHPFNKLEDAITKGLVKVMGPENAAGISGHLNGLAHGAIFDNPGVRTMSSLAALPVLIGGDALFAEPPKEAAYRQGYLDKVAQWKMPTTTEILEKNVGLDQEVIPGVMTTGGLAGLGGYMIPGVRTVMPAYDAAAETANIFRPGATGKERLGHAGMALMNTGFAGLGAVADIASIGSGGLLAAPSAMVTGGLKSLASGSGKVIPRLAKSTQSGLATLGKFPVDTSVGRYLSGTTGWQKNLKAPIAGRSLWDLRTWPRTMAASPMMHMMGGMVGTGILGGMSGADAGLEAGLRGGASALGRSLADNGPLPSPYQEGLAAGYRSMARNV